PWSRPRRSTRSARGSPSTRRPGPRASSSRRCPAATTWCPRCRRSCGPGRRQAYPMKTPVARIAGPGRWPLAVRAGQFGFVSCQLPIDPSNGRLVAGYDDVPPEGRRLQTGSLLVDSLEGAMAAQVWFTYERIGEILGSLGSSNDDILLVGGWLTDFRL